MSLHSSFALEYLEKLLREVAQLGQERQLQWLCGDPQELIIHLEKKQKSHLFIVLLSYKVAGM